jgi:outer membrane protein TolC
MRRISRAGLFLALAAAGQPAVSAGAQAPPAGPAAASLIQGGAPRLLDDPQATAVDEPLTLEAALHRALEVAPRIRQTGAAREAADAGAGWLTSPYLPTVTAGASVNRFRHPTIVTPIREPGAFPPLSDEVREGSVSLAWTVFDFGRGRDGRSAARALAEASGAREEQARLETLETVTDHFVQLALLDELQAAHSARLEGIRESEGQVRALVDEGRLPSVDHLRMTEVLLEAEADLRSTQQEIARVTASLATELALDEAPDRARVRAPSLPGELPPPLRSPDQLAGPMIDAAEARVRTAEHEVREARRALLPQLQVVARQSYRTAPDVPSERDWALGFQLQVPLFRGDAVAGVQVRDARARERAAELEGARAALQTALRDLEALERDARERIQVLDARIGHLEEAHRIELASYREGRTTLAEVLSTEARLAAARAERIGRVGAILIAHLRTASLTGELSVSEARRLLGEGS